MATGRKTMRAVTFIAVCLVTSCARPDYAERWPDRLTLSAGAQPGYAIKRVIEKVQPTTLVGDDGSVCRTSGERFAATEAGRWIGCAWTIPFLDSTELAWAER
jgi:hypothetical protein